MSIDNQLACQDEGRRQAVRAHATLNGIDYLEVLDQDAPAGSPPQRTLLVFFFKAVPALSAAQVRITGGVRVTPVQVEWAFPAPSIPAALVTPDEQAFFAALPQPDHVLVVRTDSAGDYATYRLELVRPAGGPDLPAELDPQLSAIVFSFKVDCPSDFDCLPSVCPPEPLDEPALDYLAKDYASFRRLMLDRLAVTMPDWRERNPADTGVALVEVLAYAADHLSYYQDAVATEAYLGTARRRVSVRRHARLLDYAMHDGCNARAWVCFDVEPGGAADGYTFATGTQLLTPWAPPQTAAPHGLLAREQLDAALVGGAQVFETLYSLTVRAAHDEMNFYTWAADPCCLPRGATRATLRDPGHVLADLAPGDVMIFEERLSPATGLAADADPARRHAVRLTALEFREDPLTLEEPGGSQATRVVDIAWDDEDALPFPLCLSAVIAGELITDMSVARGNVVLADHGRTLAGEDLADAPDDAPYRPALRYGPVTQQARVRDRLGRLVPGLFDRPAVFDPAAPAAAALRWALRDTLPAIEVVQNGDTAHAWRPWRDLLDSERFAHDFVVEVDDDGRAALRFGDDEFGQRPPPGSGWRATYRAGNGRAGNVGAEAIAYVLRPEGGPASGVRNVRNPMPAQGGADPETLDDVRLYAPQAFRVQERAVTVADYAAAAERHPDVQKAAATLRWTGSWHTLFVTIDRRGGRPVDDEFKVEVRAFLERFRQAGQDLAVDAPRFVPLDLALTVCVKPGYLRSAVLAALLEIFGTGYLPDGRRAFFHPDRFTFGQPVYLSQIVAAVMEVPGVSWVDADGAPGKPNRFQRWGEPAQGELADGRIRLGRLEIARLDNDPSLPENGRLEFVMEGGQ